jgi:hypothetical protein
MNYNFTHITSGTLSAYAYALSNGFILNTLTINLDSRFNIGQYVGQEGWVIYMIFMILAICVTLTNIVAMPFALMIVHIFAWWLQLIPIAYGISGVMILIGFIIISLRLSS